MGANSSICKPMTHVTSEIIDKIIYILPEAKFCKIVFLVPWKKQIVHIIWNDFPFGTPHRSTNQNRFLLNVGNDSFITIMTV